MKIRSSMLAACMLAGSALCASAQETDVHNVDIVGLKLGMPPDLAIKMASAAIGHASVQLYRQSLTMGTFTSKPLTFGARISNSDKGGDVEETEVIFSSKPGDGLVFLSRNEEYEALGQKIAMSTLKDSLIKKYGPPTFIDDSTYYEMVWNYNPSIKAGSGKKIDPMSAAGNCAIRLGKNTLSAFMLGTVDGMAGEVALTSKCGPWMKVDIFPSYTNNQLVGTMTIILGDLTKVAASYTYLNQMLAQGASASANAEKAGAVGNRPNL
jgi:hypothetical protein